MKGLRCGQFVLLTVVFSTLFCTMAIANSTVTAQSVTAESKSAESKATDREAKNDVQGIPWDDNLLLRNFVDEMVRKHDFDSRQLHSLFAQSMQRPEIIEAISRPAERVLNWDRYQDIFLTRKRIEAGARFMQQYQQPLDLAFQKYGVPQQVVTAIIGVETFYGTYRGSHRVIDALSTLAFAYPKRRQFFKKELEQFLLLTREQKLEPLEVMGSYAGAMGYSQFIASSYRHYAVDFNGDQIVDLIDNPADAIGSVANYLNVHGWSGKKGIVARATITDTNASPFIPRGLKLSQTVKDLQRSGVSFEHSGRNNEKVRLLKLLGKQGTEYWVAMQNFYAITRYNRSNLYAMAVYQLSKQLQQEYLDHIHDKS